MELKIYVHNKNTDELDVNSMINNDHDGITLKIKKDNLFITKNSDGNFVYHILDFSKTNKDVQNCLDNLIKLSWYYDHERNPLDLYVTINKKILYNIMSMKSCEIYGIKTGKLYEKIIIKEFLNYNDFQNTSDLN